MRKKIFIPFLFLLPWSVSAQSILKGVLVENTERSAIEFASVALYQSSDSSLIGGVISKADGSFEITKIKTGAYYLQVQFMGFEELVLPNLNFNKKQTLDLGTITLKPNDELLEELVVSGEKVTTMHKVDRQVFDAGQFKNSQGGTATDVIRNMPSVSINAEGTVAVRGTDGFVVLLNGKPIQSDVKMLLDQLPANAIQNVEVITAPSAKYDSEGKAGIVNIVTTQNATDGMFAQVNVKGGLPSIQTYDNENAATRYGADFTLNYQKDKWDWSLGAGYLRNDKTGRREGDVWTEIDDKRTEFPSDGERSFDEINYSGRASVGFHPSERTDINVGFYGGKHQKDRLADIYYNNKTYHLPDGAQTGSFDYYNHNLRTRTGDFLLGSIDFAHAFANESKLSTSFLYEYTLLGGPTENYNLPYDWQQTTAYYQLEYNTNENPLYGTRFNLDYALQPGEIGQWEVGYQFRNLDHQGDFDYRRYNETTDNINDRDDWEIVPEFSSELNLKRSIHSGYVMWTGEIEAWTFGGGLRAEMMDRTLEYLGATPGAVQETLGYDYFKLFPSANVQYMVNDELRLKAAYSKRVQRTTTFKMNPFKEREHSETLEQGDANLLPEFVDLIEVGVVKDIDAHSFSATAYFRNTENLINRVNTVDSDTVLNRIYTNVGTGKSLGMEFSGDLQLTDRWKLYAGANIYYASIDGKFNNELINTSAWQSSFNINTTYQITDTWSAQWSLNYLSQRVTAQGKDSKFYSPNLTVQKTFMDNRLTLSAQWLNMDMGLLDTNEQRITTTGDYVDATDGLRKAFYTTTNYVYEVDMIMINLSFKFNQLKNKAKFVNSEFGEKEF
ncbi:TonB-dependent receptor [Reichenbachiella carrageenanivorans]|uniref:TonB-dependent receptor n=1 Tax=Reichenbachiella carrageenanivorans TaxID=2979869 RepID=A0ABY6CZX0_9BACT|nr:TonB-dependent receptor [Reichenbachiella carrageenanivorans]UXX79461.1 TonB-dependent receptor [Reichenbachiella carrageenanivorans]